MPVVPRIGDVLPSGRTEDIRDQAILTGSQSKSAGPAPEQLGLALGDEAKARLPRSDVEDIAVVRTIGVAQHAGRLGMPRESGRRCTGLASGQSGYRKARQQDLAALDGSTPAAAPPVDAGVTLREHFRQRIVEARQVIRDPDRGGCRGQRVLGSLGMAGPGDLPRRGQDDDGEQPASQGRRARRVRNATMAHGASQIA